MTEALRGACVDPADAIRVLALFVAAPGVVDSAQPTVRAAQLATAALMRRAGLVSLALACADYSPASSTEALAVRDRVLALFDADILNAADMGDDAVFDALRSLRGAVATDLTDRAAQLPAVITVETAQPEPSLVLAYRLYDAVRREPGMVARAAVIHPLFVPPVFEALSS